MAIRSHARGTLRLLLLAGAAGIAACGAAEADAPAVAFTYNFGDTAFQAFLEEELERHRTPDAVRLRVVGAQGDFRDSLGLGALSAEVARATALVRDPTVIVAVGPGGSREVLQVAPIYREGGLPDLVPTATSRLLAGLGPLTFLLAPDDSVQGEFIGAFADSVLGARSAVILQVPDEYGIGLAAGTASAFAARGVRVLDRITIRLIRDCMGPEDVRAYDAVAEQVALRGTPDVAVLAARTVEAACAARALRRRFPRIVLLAGDGTYFERSFLVRAGPAAEAAYLVAFWHPGVARPGSAEFAQAFAARVGRRARHGDAGFYDATMLAGAAIRAVGADRARVAEYFRTLGRSRPAFEGIAGPVAFTPGRSPALLMTRIRGDSTEVVSR